MRDKLVIDLETKNTFDDVGGKEHIEKLEISLVGLYSYGQDRYLAFRDNELERLGPLLQNASLVIGFSINRFDLPVLAKHFTFNVMALPRLDLLEEIELAYGSRISLNILAQTNLGRGKTFTGLDAIRFYQQGDWQTLEDYCLNDVRVTKELYDFVRDRRYLMIPKKYSGELVKVPLNIREIELPATLF